MTLYRKYIAWYKIIQILANLWPTHKETKKLCRLLENTAKKFNSNNIMFLNDRNTIVVWIQSKKHKNQMTFGTILCDPSWDFLHSDNAIVHFSCFCKMILESIDPEKQKWYKDSRFQTLFKFEESDLKFVDAMAKFNGLTEDEFKIYLDLLGY
jgi:hypothetical protein